MYDNYEHKGFLIKPYKFEDKWKVEITPPKSMNDRSPTFEIMEALFISETEAWANGIHHVNNYLQKDDIRFN